MASDFEIGRVMAVDTAQVTIQLNADLKALTRTTYEGAQEVGRINSYVLLPVGARRLVAMITRVVLVEDAELKADRTSVTLPSARRLMKATLIGTIDGKRFTQGISIFPVLDNPVHLPSADDLDVIFDRNVPTQGDQQTPADPEDPGFCVHIGDSAVFQDRPIQINPDAFFGKHAAVLGSTGSGKSCTIAALLQSILKRPDIRRTHFIILDTNGEYRTAFQKQEGTGAWVDVGKWRVLYIPSDPQHADERVVIPYWFMNANDFVRLFRAREGLQSPVLLRALRLARAGAAGTSDTLGKIETLRTACAQILASALNDTPSQQWAITKNIYEQCQDCAKYRETFPEIVHTLQQDHGDDTFDNWEQAIAEVQSIVSEVYTPGAKNNEVMGATRLQRIKAALEPVIAQLNEIAAGSSGAMSSVTADQPLFFERHQFLESALETAMREQTESGNVGRVRDACGPMFLRIRRFFEDPRFEFLFRQFPNADHVLASFLRDVLGLPSADNAAFLLSDDTAVPSGTLPFYDRQRSGTEGHDVVILDLSLLAAEVLENVTALIGRLILEFLQRLGEHGGEFARGSLPVVLVLEEAQNYIREQRFGDDDSISRLVFDRIAREGRKYGLGLVIASQRPSEVSKTVLSQCNSFVVHRLQNPEDLRYFKEIVPGVYGPMLDQLPALARQTALVLGECVRAPALVKIREARPLPRSRDPKFFKYWTSSATEAFDVEGICAHWEGKPPVEKSDEQLDESQPTETEELF